MPKFIHITSGDIAGEILAKSGIPGEVMVWHDILYDGPRKPGWPDDDVLSARARFLEKTTGGGLEWRHILDGLKEQYARLKSIPPRDKMVLWFDACLFDMSMLCHILACVKLMGRDDAELLCIDAFPGIDPYHGLGQLSPEQLASLFDRRHPVTKDQFIYATRVDRSFALQDLEGFKALAEQSDTPLPWVPAAVSRWIRERPDASTGLGHLEQLALNAIRSGLTTPSEIFRNVSAKETPPQYWGDITLWAKINGLADRKPPAIRIEGPTSRLPQWEGISDIKQYRVYPMETN